MRSTPLLFMAPLLTTAALAQAEVIEKTSPHDVTTTIDQLVHAVEEAGASIIARVDHSGAAADAGLELRPTELLIFGNPQLGTPLMQQDQRIGLECRCASLHTRMPTGRCISSTRMLPP